MSMPSTSAERRPTGRRGVRGGFTLIELLVVSVLGALILSATYTILITNQRTYQVQGIQVTNQQAMRQALETLAGEIREVSARDGDLLLVDSDELRVRVMRNFGLVCSVAGAFLATPNLTVKKMTDWFGVNDSVYVFADNDELLTTDDEWIQVAVSAVDTTRSCNGSDQAQLLTFNGAGAVFGADTVRVGAPVRAFTRYEYDLASWNGQFYLGRRDWPGGSFEPMIGPLYDRRLGTTPSTSPVEFKYYDASGSTTTTATDVRRIDIMIRTWSPVEDGLGNNVTDSLSMSVYTRN